MFVKWLVHSKMKILSSFVQFYDIPQTCMTFFILFLEHKKTTTTM